MQIEWIPGNRIVMNSQTIKEYGIAPGRVIFHFGSWVQQADIRRNEDFAPHTIGLLKDWKKRFSIPDHLPYKMYSLKNRIHLGPVIALIVFSEHKKINAEQLDDFRGYFTRYSKINGLLYLCASDGIDTKRQAIKGYYFDPHAPKGATPWKEGTFPYPGAAYNRTRLSRRIFDHLSSRMAGRIFNSYSNGSFSKWELWMRLSPFPELRSHLPYTIPVKQVKDLDESLKKYGAVYLKPTRGTLSKGIRKVKRSRNGYLVEYPNREGKKPIIKRRIGEPTEISNWLRELKSREYLIQQAINMKRYKKMPIDFRVIMQKNGRNKWQCTGTFGKFGKKGSIITNFSRSGFVRPGIAALQLAFGMNDQEAMLKMKKLQAISFRICRIFDQYGNYGDLGIDLMIDKNGKIWILEVNTLDTYHQFPLHIDDKALYLKVVTTPLNYAKYLTGFM
ncbi:YheC/YheD family protein [Ammoniphilus sp. 3BR4]|uniref:YheC/YheD family endospore coat-associated protein n=1 Tax=Ammoniphilus sp. 3BR4 TaxID=3158265 RepID=UPI003465BF69